MMARFLNWLKSKTDIILVIALYACVACVLFFPLAVLFLPLMTACTTTQDRTFNLSKYDIHITEILCSTIAKDAAVRVFMSKTGERNENLLFKYSSIDY